jgi:fructan beta-fructosidase
MSFRIVLLFLALILQSCSIQKPETQEELKTSRPLFHFTPPENWINDPNGLVYYDGEYHLFYQHNPYGIKQAHLSWGHAVSKNLLKWEDLPIALREYKDPATGDTTMIFSGTCVVDPNTSGLCEGKDCMIAIYTSHVSAPGKDQHQHQSLAYSNDKGRIWKLYSKNPILDTQRKHFRDPKVFWHEPTKKWVMALAVSDVFKVEFYESQNLIDWKLLSEFGGTGNMDREWECPDLFELPVENEPRKTKWVLTLSGGHPQKSFPGMQYFVGSFDGTSFKADEQQSVPSWVGYGKDFFAGIIINQLPKEQNRTVMIGWVNSWNYANKIPASTYRGALSLPRELGLRKNENSYLLIQRPIKELETLRGEEIVDLNKASGKTLEIELDIMTDMDGGIKVFKTGEEETIIGYDSKSSELFIDRTKSGTVDFDPGFASVDRAPIKPKGGKIHVRMFLDHPIIEVFANDGEVMMTEYAFATGKDLKIETYGNVQNGKGWELK